ncbi:Elongation factor G [Planctomycetes bacterium Pan216]|uniref:Elongation factor G n=1 Tax=Kolteria novifilia TaxID=2527975 RepID=A0A518AWV7_9BACT|nr:Elongation factor G [Planctomycetes bacterium Pan216]
MGNVSVRSIRNLAFAGHGAVGKTTLCDALLFSAKATDRKGSVDDGTSLLDFDEEEKHRKHSIDSSLCHLEWDGKRIQMIDTPGSPDFQGQAISAIHNVETAVIVIDAHRGIEVNTRRMFEEAGKAGVARIIFLNKLDSEGIEYETLVNLVRETFGNECIPIQLPVGLGPDLKDVVNLLTPPPEWPDGLPMDAAALREELIEDIVETNDELLEGFFEGNIPPTEVLAETLDRAIVSGQIIPIMGGSAKKGIGLTQFLEEVATFAPSPTEGLLRSARAEDDEIALQPDPEKPFVGRVFKTLVDKFGNQTFIRVYQGCLHPNANVRCARDSSTHRLGQLHVVQGKEHEKVDEIGPGEFLCVAKVDGVEINDTLTTNGDLLIPPVRFPRPMFPLAVGAKEHSDDAKIIQSLRKLVHEDPCLIIHRDDETLETIMEGTSQLHLEVIQNRVKQRDGVEIVTHEPKIPYKETITIPGEGTFRHKKQTGGRGQFAEVHLRLKPRQPGEGFEFVNSIVGGAIPGQYIPAVEKGVREVMARGILSGSEIIDLEAEVHFGKYHDVDSSEQAFKYAAAMAFKEAFEQCKPCLLEPVVSIEVIVPAERMGDVNGDLNTRRAHITGLDALPGGLQVVKAQVPLAEVLRYQTELKSLTAGQGSFSMEFDHMAVVPANVQQQVMAKYAQPEMEEHH